MAEDRRKKVQWHPAFVATLKIELEDELDNLIFDPEHLLSSKPMQVDVLIIKKAEDDKSSDKSQETSGRTTR